MEHNTTESEAVCARTEAVRRSTKDQPRPPSAAQAPRMNSRMKPASASHPANGIAL